MTCFHPLTAFKPSDGGAITFHEVKDSREISLPCGQCQGCRATRAGEWAIRMVHEAQGHTVNLFLTLTYDEDHIPADHSLNYKHLQSCWRALRKAGFKFRFFACGEYGEKTSRPHYHACAFGLDLPDLRPYGGLRDSGQLYTSEILDRCWAQGACKVGYFSPQTAGYVARYVMKKRTGPQAEKHYEIADPDTGEIHSRSPEFSRMSLKPGIGANWCDQHGAYSFTFDHVVIDGRKQKPPGYYADRHRVADPVLMETVDALRAEKGIEHAPNKTRARLAVRETVFLSRQSQLKRNTL